MSSSSRRTPLALAVLGASLLILLLSAAPSAQAATSHVFTTAFGTTLTGDPVPLAEPTGVAVDNSSGPSAHDVYVTDPGVDERQTITITAIGGTYKLSFRGQTTARISPSQEPEAVAAALEALSTIGAGNISVGDPNGPGELVLTFRGTLGSTDLEQITVDSSELTGTATVATTVPGVSGAAVEKFAPSGQFLLIFGREVNKGKVDAGGATEAEENVCVAGEECQPGTPGISPGAFEHPTYIAVDGSDDTSAGDLYVADPEAHLVQKFDPSGHIVPSFGEAGQQDGANTGSKANFDFLWGIAVGTTGRLFVMTNPSGSLAAGNGPSSVHEFDQDGDHLATFHINALLLGSSYQSPGLAVDSAGSLYTVGLGKVQKYEPTGEYLAPVTSAAPTTGFAFDIPGAELGDELYQDTGSVIDHYSSDCDLFCTPHDSFGSADLTAAQGVAVDAASHTVFVANSGSDDVAVFDDVRPQATTGPLSAGTSTSATVTARVDPAGHGDITTCEFEYGREKSYGSSVSCAQVAPYSGEVTATISGLPPGFRGHYRVVVSNAAGGTAEGADEPFTVAEPPSIDGLEAANLTATSAELIARVNPNDLDTTYRFEYGTTTAYGQLPSSPEPAIEAELGRDHTVRVQLTGLSPNAVYHYRLLAENAAGTTAAEDHTFNYYPPACPNSTVRQQTGSDGLPDCRAYELVTPSSSGTALVFPAGATPNTGLATNPSRLAYNTWGGIVPGTPNPSNSYGDMYVASRTDQGWVSKYVGLPADQAFIQGGPPWAVASGYTLEPDKVGQAVLANPSLSKVVVWNDGEYETAACTGCGEGLGSSNAPYVWDSTSGGLLERWPTNLSEVSGGGEFKGQTAASADLSHFVFSSNVAFPVVETETKAAVKGAVYDYDTATGRTAVVSLNAEGHNIKVVPDKLSSDGSHILMSNPIPACSYCSSPLASPVHLYMRVDDSVTYEIAPGHLVSYAGMTADGSRLYFTSEEHLTGEDPEHGGAGLYMWSAEKAEQGEEPLTLISKGESDGAGQPGNTAACSPALIEEINSGFHPTGNQVPWTAGCGIAPISFVGYSTLQGGLGGNGYTDSAVASENGDIYFFSPEQLLSGKGIAGQENLYLYRGGALQFVAALKPSRACVTNRNGTTCSEDPVGRMDVSPDDSHMAFVTASQVTSYDNAGHTEMYSYVPATGKLTCDSCLPSGEPPTSEVYASQNGLFMANDGRAFFSTEDALVPQDTNRGEDVYEFVAGRPQLITSGAAASNNSLNYGLLGLETLPGLDAVSSNGTNVYFATYETLVGQDENGESIKIYDARTGGGFPFTTPPPPCAAADECHGPGSSPPLTPAGGTGASLGAGGNVASESHPKLHKKHKKKHHRRSTAKRHHQAVHHSRGGKK